ncbi:MAG: UDP-N-acetylglucosamine 2-epimerase (non-hydrolyzing) [Bacillota bacterium]|nr:UDP-N-acetylglucosamine 2-epimerase (non-hydrolyzing) [Bacillota bacterium]
MSKLKTLVVFGTRPEAIKMAPLVKELKKNRRIECGVCVTAQHREMLDMVLNLFDIKPDFDFNIMTPSQTLNSIASKVISHMQDAVTEFKPDLVLVHGDTTTAVTAALASFYAGARVGHVEAGLRSFDKYSPYPEELNRLVISDIADIHFAATHANKENLNRENIHDNIYITGNTVIDALKYTIHPNYKYKSPDVQKAVERARENNMRIVLMTAHRRENLGQPFENIFNAVHRAADEFKDVLFLYPVHPNPRVKNTAKRILGNVENVVLTSPIDTDDMHNIMNDSFLVLTDSGGLQEEAPALGKPVLVLRHETERPEAVTAGTVKISGVEEEDVYNDLVTLFTDSAVYDKMAKAVNPYGDGHASERIVQAILHKFADQPAPKEFGI